MAFDDYKRALKLGKKEFQNRLIRGQNPVLEVLTDRLTAAEIKTQEELGLIQIPISQIVGTRYAGRSNAFAANFMPILNDNSEFAVKWQNLSEAHREEGVHDSIKAVEYMNRFYVEEGNKRVSVLKYFDAVSITGTVTRLIPKENDRKETKIYYEFLEFYKLAPVQYLVFSRQGSYARLQKAVGKKPDEIWTEDELLDFHSSYSRFENAYMASGGKKLKITLADAFLAFIELYDYAGINEYSSNDLKKLVEKSFREYKMLEEEEEVELKMAPEKEKKSLLNRLLPLGKSNLKVAFLYEKSVQTSAWVYAHELGRLHLEQTFPEEVTTFYYDNCTAENAEEYLQKAVAEGCNIIFTTSPVFAKASVKAAVDHPQVYILNCSLNTSHKYIRTYYSRMHEAKFLMGAIAGSMAENDRISYIADYPLYGTISNINAFALGAKMVNPRAKIYLEWSTKKDTDVWENISRTAPSCVSGKDMVIPEEGSRYFGIYHMEEDGHPRNLALPLYHWGKFYEKLIRRIMDGKWKQDEDSEKAINYWWGMSAGVIDIICSQTLPVGTKRLIELLKKTISSGEFHLFCGELYSQEGMVQDSNAGALTPEEIMEMDWLAENVIGEIPKKSQLLDHAVPVVSQQGIEKVTKPEAATDRMIETAQDISQVKRCGLW